MEGRLARLPRAVGEGHGGGDQGCRDAEEGGGSLEAAARQMRWSAETLRRLAIGLVLLGSVGMMLSMLICAADVVGTNFFDWPVPGTLEITESTMVLIVFGALAFTQEKRGHIRVEILHGIMCARLKAPAQIVCPFLPHSS